MCIDAEIATDFNCLSFLDMMFLSPDLFFVSYFYCDMISKRMFVRQLDSFLCIHQQHFVLL